jgi:predicted MFS family arabinose efflux permease
MTQRDAARRAPVTAAMDGAALRLGVGGTAAVAVTYGLARYGYGLFVPEFRRYFALSTTALGLIASASYVCYLLVVIGTGVLEARVGPRAPILLSGAMAASGMALMAAAMSAEVLAAGVLLAGSSAGLSWAPYSDAVAEEVPSASRPATLSMVSTGTSFGLVAAATIALVAGEAWRVVWIVFAACAVAATLYNAVVLPRGPAAQRRHREPLRPQWFVNRRTAPLLIYAFAYTMLGAVFLTYAVDLVRAAGLPSSAGPLLWVVIGLTGLSALRTGDLVERRGLSAACSLTIAGLVASVVALALAPGASLVAVAAAMTFGASYMVAGAVLAVWSSTVFADRPTIGFTAAIVMAALGSIAGPAVIGLLSSNVSLRVSFVLAAGLGALALLARPRSG